MWPPALLRLLGLRRSRCPCEYFLYRRGEGSEAIRARQPKIIGFRMDQDGATRAPLSKLEANFSDVLARKQLLHLCHGFINRAVRCVVFDCHTETYYSK